MTTMTPGVQSVRTTSVGDCREADNPALPVNGLENQPRTREFWPPDLTQVTSLVLGANLPLCVIWGPERVRLFNNEYLAVSNRRVSSTGQEVSNRPLQTAAPAVDRCFETGKASCVIDEPVLVDRDGQLTETFHTLYYSPIRDKTGRVAGVFHPAVETTQLVLARRRARLLRRIAACSSQADSIDKALARSVEVLGEHPLDVPFAAAYRISTDDQAAELVGCTGLSPDHPACPPGVRCGADAAEPWPLETAMLGTGPVCVQGLADRFPGWACGPHSQPPRHAFIHRIDVAGRPAALLIVGVSSLQPLDDEYRDFQEMLAAAVAGVAANGAAAEGRSTSTEAGAVDKQGAALLQQAKQEVEAIAHTLSHDVRAPLRHIDGLVQMLEERDGAAISPEGRRLLERFRANAERMGTLIDDLVRLSLVGRGELLRIKAGSDALVRGVWTELQREAGTTAVLEQKPLPPCDADPGMLKLLWRSLIGNAIKFSGPRAMPHVIIDSWQEGGRTWYRVADNGIGFDQQYAHKLFKVFQRLHRADQFPGNGIGLAIAKKIVDLHGGVIRARGAPDCGAVFEFSFDP